MRRKHDLMQRMQKAANKMSAVQRADVRKQVIDLIVRWMGKTNHSFDWLN